MHRDELTEELRLRIGDYLREQGADLVELTYRYEARGMVLRILVDKPEGGISIDECSRFNRELGALLDELPLDAQGYLLEVSSPGLDRPLVTARDFFRCLNRRVRLFLREPVSGTMELDGRIQRVTEEAVCIERQGDVLELPLGKIRKAQQVI